MVAIPPIFTFPEKPNGYMYLGLAELSEYSYRRTVTSLVIAFDIPSVSKSHLLFSRENGMEFMVFIPPIFAFSEEIKCFHLYISLVELAASSNLYTVFSLVIRFEISLVFSHLAPPRTAYVAHPHLYVTLWPPVFGCGRLSQGLHL